jgi:CDP-glucose 4,6-dehydratase
MRNFYRIFKNKKVLITGHTGFKGSWLTFWLLQLNARICGISKDIPTKPSLFTALNLKKNIIDKKLDIRDLTKLKKTINNFKPDFLFHLAAQPLVKNSYDDPINTFTSNAIGTCNVLESVKFLKKRCNVIIITSDKSYKNLEILRGYRETDLLGGHDPYSASKGCAEFIIQSYVKSFFKNKKNLRLGVARAGNVIGGGDWSDYRVIPDCLKSWSKNKTVTIRSPNSTRPWQHVLEVLKGYLMLAINLKNNKNNHGEVFNFGPKNFQNKRVIDVLNEMHKFLPNLKWNVKIKKKFRESNLLKLNSTKAKKKLKWTNKLSFNETIKMTAEWYRMYYKKKNMISFTSKQIKEFGSKS